MTLEVGRQYRRREFQWRVLLWVPIVLAVGIVGAVGRTGIGAVLGAACLGAGALGVLCVLRILSVLCVFTCHAVSPPCP